MLLSFITPTKFISKYQDKSDFMLTLSHLIDEKGENEYTQAILSTGKPIYLDNGVFENGVPESIESLAKKAHMLSMKGRKPKMVFLPDVLYSAEQTYENVLEWNSYYQSSVRDLVKVLSCVVLQGNSKKDFVELIEKLRTVNIDAVALSYLACVRCFREETGTEDIATNRIAALKELQKHAFMNRVHLLGMGDSMEDLVFAKSLSNIFTISHDSSSAFMTGLHGKCYEGTKIPG